jgi:hypothetical protein
MEDAFLQSKFYATSEGHSEEPGGQLIVVTTPKLWIKKKRVSSNPKSNQKLRSHHERSSLCPSVHYN